MPTMNNYLNFIYVNLGFVAQIIVMMYFKSALEIRENWSLYRCNPPYWIFSENVSDDFNYCIQNTQVNLMGYLLQPMNYMISSLSSMSSNFNDSINQIRFLFSGTRDFVTNIVQSIFGVFLNMIIEFQKMIISIKDMVGKMIGIVVTIMYILDGSIKTMNSSWAGPPGQLVRAIGSCFHPDTLIQLKNGTIYKMQDLPLGCELTDGGIVFSVMKIANLKKDYLYKINKDANNPTIYVTGEHFMLDEKTKKWIMVKDYSESILQRHMQPEWFSCIITTSGRIPIGDIIFWDWEDDELTKSYNH
jgi:hypothetical protein